MDRFGRPQRDPTRLGEGLTLTTLCADAGIPIREVPGNYWSLDVSATDPDEPVAVVSCPCGSSHTLPLMEGPQGDAEGTTGNFAACSRGYLFDGVHVWALNSPTPVSATGAEGNGESDD